MTQRLATAILAGSVIGIVVYFGGAILSVFNTILPLGWLFVLMAGGILLAIVYEVTGPRRPEPPNEPDI